MVIVIIKLYSIISVSFVLLCLPGCTKDKTNAIGYDPSFINLVDYDDIFIGDWKTANQGEEFYLYFDIPEQGNSHYISDHKYNNLPPIDISKIAKYNDGSIFLEDQKKIQIDKYPILSNDTVLQYSINGQVKYIYSAIMVIDGDMVYRVDEIIY